MTWPRSLSRASVRCCVQPEHRLHVSDGTFASSDAASVRPLSFVLGVQYRILAQTNQRRAKPAPEFMQALNKLLSTSAN